MVKDRQDPLSSSPSFLYLGPSLSLVFLSVFYSFFFSLPVSDLHDRTLRGGGGGGGGALYDHHLVQSKPTYFLYNYLFRRCTILCRSRCLISANST